MLITVKNISCSADGKNILSLPEFSVHEGRHCLLSGPSGCGKTTLMNIMSGLLRPDTGDVFFEGRNITDLRDSALDDIRRKSFGFVFQRLHLIGHLTAFENVAIAQDDRDDKDRVSNLLFGLGLSDKKSCKAGDLSVGEAQRVAIARAVVNGPKIIFADEPTSALDDINTEKVMDLLFSQADITGATIIAATHDDRIKRRFQNILEMTS